MGEQALQEKYRPRRFEDFHGNKDTVAALKTLVQRDRGKINSILLIGPRGCGKTTLAGIIRNELKIGNQDFTEMNTANVRGIDTIRDVIAKSAFLPLKGSKKIYFFDECHKLTNDAQNAMLKLLENPPDHVLFVLATTDPEKLLSTVLSRCAKFPVALLKTNEIIALVKSVLQREGVTDYPEDAIKEIALVCDGSPREALILLDATIDIVDETALFRTIRKHVVDDSSVRDFCQALLQKKSWKEIAGIVKNLPGVDEDQERIRYAVMTYLSKVLLDKDDARVALMLGEFVNNTFMYSKKAGLIAAAYNCYIAG